MSKPIVLVTGGTGLVGAHLLYDLIQAGYYPKAVCRSTKSKQKTLEIFSYYSDSPNEFFNKIEWLEGDLLDYLFCLEALHTVEYVYHCAAYVSFNPFERQKILDTNIKGTKNIVNACHENKIKKLCYVSSVAALGHNEDGSPINEDTSWTFSPNRSAYSLSKFFSETEVWRGIEEGLSAVIVNPSVILGPGNWQSGSSSIIHSIAGGLRYYTSGTTGYVDVRDVTKAMVWLMNSELSGQRYVLNQGNYYYKDFFAMISKALQIKTQWKLVKPWMLQFAWRWEYLMFYLFRKSPRITKDIISSGKSINFYSAKKIKSLGFEFVEMNDTIEHVTSCFQKQNRKMIRS